MNVDVEVNVHYLQRLANNTRRVLIVARLLHRFSVTFTLTFFTPPHDHVKVVRLAHCKSVRAL